MSQQNYNCCYCGDNTANNLVLSCGHYMCKSCTSDYIQVINDDFQLTCSCSFITFVDLSIKSIGNLTPTSASINPQINQTNQLNQNIVSQQFFL